MAGAEYKPLAWNGVSLEIPAGWEVENIDKTYLLISGEEKSEPAPKVEIKWDNSTGRSKGSGTPVSLLKRFIRQAKKKLGVGIREEAAPSGFKPPRKETDYLFFSWSGNESRGDGVVIFCRKSCQAVLMRFLSGSLLAETSWKPDENPAARILSSFKGWAGAETVPWDIFGMAFTTPCDLTLDEYSFKPGAFTLFFSGKRIILRLFSWGPASFLLGKMDITAFARQRIPDLQGLAVSGQCAAGDFFQWKWARLSGVKGLPVLNRMSRYHLFRISREEGQNRILAVGVESGGDFEYRLMEGSFLGKNR